QAAFVVEECTVWKRPPSMRWISTGCPPASTIATAIAWPAFRACSVAWSIIFRAPTRVRRLLSATYIRVSSVLHAIWKRRDAASALQRIIRRIFQHSHGASMKTPSGDPSHVELRDAVRDLCRKFDGEYWRKVDEERAYPEAFAKALTEAGWLAALIPEEYGGSGLSVTRRCHRPQRDCTAPALPLRRLCRLRARPDVRDGLPAPARLGGSETALSAENRERRVAHAVDGRHRAYYRHEHDQPEDRRRQEGRSLCRKRAKGVHFAS